MFTDYKSHLSRRSLDVYLIKQCTSKILANVIIEDVMIIIVGMTKPNIMIHIVYVKLLLLECQSGVQLYLKEKIVNYRT